MGIQALGAVKGVEPGNMHLTLKFLGEQDETLVDKARLALESVEHPGFRMEVRGLGAFPDIARPKVIWAGIGAGGKETAELSATVDAALKPLGYQPENRFHPHITLARVKGHVNPLKLSQTIEASRQTIYGSYDAAEFTLMESRLTPAGPKYSTLKSYPLQ